MPNIIIEGFYNKGVDAYVEGEGFSNSTFTAEPDRVSIGIKPHPAAKISSDPKWEVIKYRNVEYLVLNKGYTYDVKFKKGKDPIVIDAKSDHAVWDLPTGYVVDSAKAQEWQKKD